LLSPERKRLYEQHEECRAEARRLYEDSLIPADRAADWDEALKEAGLAIGEALSASGNLRDIASALQVSGRHMFAFRHFLAPPASQDQFKLICSAWSKSSERSGSSMDQAQASIVAQRLNAWRSQRLAPWLALNREPTNDEIAALTDMIAPLMASQRVATARRNRLATNQEQALIGRLLAHGWAQLPSALIDNQGAIAPRQFMHKARFASGTTGRAEVDIALGVTSRLVVAMECKVTNDETNSVKRVNDVLKKAAAWKDHWGNFIESAALLEGVIKATDVKRLIDHNVHVFWSHRLDLFDGWLSEHVS
jgi:hypothetical protein